MKIDYLQEIRENELLRKRLAKLMALDCFRNSKLEDLHAGTFPSSQAEDYTDVKVVSPYGEIAWSNLSRLNDDEMKTLMIDVVNRCDQFLVSSFREPGDRRSTQGARSYIKMARSQVTSGVWRLARCKWASSETWLVI
jgi:hypothetical protein